jgi:hypothetical protein
VGWDVVCVADPLGRRKEGFRRARKLNTRALGGDGKRDGPWCCARGC